MHWTVQVQLITNY